MSSRRALVALAPTRRKARQKPEETLQRACVHVLEHYVPKPPEGPVWTAINPVAAKSRAVAGVSKAMGLRAGWPDMHLLHRSRSIFIEFKADKGRVASDQRDLHEEIRLAGGVTWVVRSLEEFLRALEVACIPCKVKYDCKAVNTGLPLTNKNSGDNN